MPWSLTIHHIDVTTAGDATLIIAAENGVALPRFAACLIDGGPLGATATLDAYLAVALNGNPLDVMVATHFDQDHIGGLTGLLLLTTTNRYANTWIYDQGWPGAAAPDGPTSRFLRAIAGLNTAGGGPGAGGRTRPTNSVLAEGGALAYIPAMTLRYAPAWPGGGAAAINVAADHLINTEILWGPAGAVPAGAPTITCIAANSIVRDPTQMHDPFGPTVGGGIDPRNEKSLAFVVTFGNFRYYIGGDIETTQEAHLENFLNAANNAAGRVQVIKTSHHGSNTATSRAFLDRLRPEVAVISCGTNNQHGHPAQEVVNVLDGYAWNVARHAAAPPPPSNHPVDYFLTGYQRFPGDGYMPAVLAVQTLGGDTSTTCGDPTTGHAGDVVISVSAVQSAVDARGRLTLGVLAAVRAAATATFPLVPLAAPGAGFGAATAEAALLTGPAGAASAAAVEAGAAGGGAAALAASASAVNFWNATPIIMASFTFMGVRFAGGNVAVAACAAAAAGAAVGGGTAAAILAAVQQALTDAGVAAAPALVAATAASLLAVPNAPGQFDVGYWDLTAAALQNVTQV